MRKLFFVFGVCFLAIGDLYSQYEYLDNLKKSSTPDTGYVVELPFRFLVNPSFYVKTNNFSINSIDPNASRFVYKPNTPMKMSIVGAYKWLRLGFSFNLPSYLNDKGNTKSFGIYLNTQTKILNWGLDFYYLKNKGYYMANPEAYIPHWTSRDGYPFRSDLTTVNIGLFTHVVFSQKFSLKAALQQSEKQLKSAGGFGLQIGFSYDGLKNDSGIVPYSQKQYYPEIYTMSKARFSGLHFSPGYAYTYVYKDVYATSIAHIGVGLQFQSYMLYDVKMYGFVIAPNYKFQQVIGYNASDSFVKISFMYRSYSFNIKHSKFKNNFMSISLGGGIRFL